MERIWEQIQNIFSNLDISINNIPLSQIIIVAVVMSLILALRRFFTQRIIKAIESFTAKTETTLDDEFIAAIKKPLGWLIILAGVWISQLILADNLSPQLNEAFEKLISLSLVMIIAWAIYSSATVLGHLLGLLATKTNTELDDLIVPHIPQLIQTVVVIVVIIKSSEVLLGASAGALIGLLGGAGVALGLIFKDIIYDWCCTVIIYLDDLYRPGQWLVVDGIDGFVKVVRIGLRSTMLWVWECGSVKKVPNSKMIDGLVENWDQNRGETLEWGITGTLQIDFLSAEQTSRVIDGLLELLNSMDDIYENPMVTFKGIEGNARIFKYLAYVAPNAYFTAAKNINMEILRLLEREGINNLQIYLVTDHKSKKEMMEQVTNLN